MDFAKSSTVRHQAALTLIAHAIRDSQEPSFGLLVLDTWDIVQRLAVLHQASEWMIPLVLNHSHALASMATRAT